MQASSAGQSKDRFENVMMTENQPSCKLQWISQRGYRLRISGRDTVLTVYIDPNLRDEMLPKYIKLRIKSSVALTDANLILLTHVNHPCMASAVMLALAAEDRSCRIVCPKEVAV